MLDKKNKGGAQSEVPPAQTAGFPTIEKVALPDKSNEVVEKQDPAPTPKPTIKNELKNHGLVEDETIAEENINKIMEMSKEQIMQEQ